MKPRLPDRNRDLRRYVFWRRLLQVLGYLAFTGLFAVGADRYNAAHQTYPPEKLILGWKWAVWMVAALLLGFFLFRIYRLFSLRPLRGVILDSGLSHAYTGSADPGYGGRGYDFRTRTVLTVQDARGRKHRLRFEQKPGFYLYYYPGTSCCRLGGLHYPVCDPRSRAKPERRGREAFDDLSGGRICVACGLLNQASVEKCANCGFTIVEPEDLFGESD